jgi:hypothetical protein
MRKKHHAKKVVRNTPKRCVSCDKILTTIDMCYSSDINICWQCDKQPKQAQLF